MSDVSDDPWKAQLEVLGGLLRAQRMAADLSLRELSERTKVSNAYLSQLERGLHEPSLSVLRAIASALGVPLGSLRPRRRAHRPDGGLEGAQGDLARRRRMALRPLRPLTEPRRGHPHHRHAPGTRFRHPLMAPGQDRYTCQVDEIDLTMADSEA